MFKLPFSGNLHLLKRSLRLLPPVFHLHNESMPPKNSRLSNPLIDFFLDEAAQHSKPLHPSSLNPQAPPKSLSQNKREEIISSKKRVGMSHPWPEWAELMDKLLNCGYIDKTGHPFGTSELGSMDFNQIRTACLIFARDHVHVMRFLSKGDIEVVAGAGCPSLDKRLVDSGKRLRAHVGIDERNVCSSCVLRGNCARANVRTREDEGGRTVDVVHMLFTYGIDVVVESVENKPCLNEKVIASVKKLLREVVAYSSDSNGQNRGQTIDTMHVSSVAKDTPTKQGDWNCSKCNFLNFARNVKCLRCEVLIEERNAEQANLPLKKKDWICAKCNFSNFARNPRCLLCKEKPSGKELGPGEWECDSCNYHNFKRNIVCLKCNHQKPKSKNYAPPPSQSATSDNTRLQCTRPYLGHEKHSSGDKEGCDRLDFVGNDQECLNPNKDEPCFFDFSVIGGKGNVSKDAHKQEMWRIKMALQKRYAANDQRENTDSTSVKSGIFHRKPQVSSVYR